MSPVDQFDVAEYQGDLLGIDDAVFSEGYEVILQQFGEILAIILLGGDQLLHGWGEGGME